MTLGTVRKVKGAQTAAWGVLRHSCEVLLTDDVMPASLSVCLSDMLQVACLLIKRASPGNNNNKNNNK